MLKATDAQSSIPNSLYARFLLPVDIIILLVPNEIRTIAAMAETPII
jgi:hypothetical protein